jgi:hypothetical protein
VTFTCDPWADLAALMTAYEQVRAGEHAAVIAGACSARPSTDGFAVFTEPEARDFPQPGPDEGAVAFLVDGTDGRLGRELAAPMLSVGDRPTCRRALEEWMTCAGVGSHAERVWIQHQDPAAPPLEDLPPGPEWSLEEQGDRSRLPLFAALARRWDDPRPHVVCVDYGGALGAVAWSGSSSA